MFYLCVDCGGTKTAAAISDASGSIVGRGLGGPSNITYLSSQQFISSIREAVAAALHQASPTSQLSAPGVFTAAWFGISGADSPSAIAKVAQPLSDLLAIPLGHDLVIANDTHLLAAPLRMHRDITHAVAVIAGTGSIAVSFSKNESRKIVEEGRVGGWGWILGDEGGGYDVGRETIRQILMEQDKASVTGKPLVKGKLIQSILDKFSVDNVMDTLGAVYQADPAPGATIAPGEEKAIHNLPREKRLSSIPPLVFDAAFKHNDPLALNILKTSASHLAAEVAVLLGDGLDTDRAVKASESVISFGGSLVGIEDYRKLLLDDLAARGHTFKKVVFIDNAATTGATALAVAYQSHSS